MTCYLFSIRIISSYLLFLSLPGRSPFLFADCITFVFSAICLLVFLSLASSSYHPNHPIKYPSMPCIHWFTGRRLHTSTKTTGASSTSAPWRRACLCCRFNSDVWHPCRVFPNRSLPRRYPSISCHVSNFMNLVSWIWISCISYVVSVTPHLFITCVFCHQYRFLCAFFPFKKCVIIFYIILCIFLRHHVPPTKKT